MVGADQVRHVPGVLPASVRGPAGGRATMTDLSDTLRLAADIQERVTHQSYVAAPDIAGVQLIDLNVFSDEGGDFAEIARFTADGTLAALPAYRPAQLSY